jgi:hypothetical protein
LWGQGDVECSVGEGEGNTGRSLVVETSCSTLDDGTGGQAGDELQSVSVIVGILGDDFNIIVVDRGESQQWFGGSSGGSVDGSQGDDQDFIQSDDDGGGQVTSAGEGVGAWAVSWSSDLGGEGSGHSGQIIRKELIDGSTVVVCGSAVVVGGGAQPDGCLWDGETSVVGQNDDVDDTWDLSQVDDDVEGLVHGHGSDSSVVVKITRGRSEGSVSSSVDWGVDHLGCWGIDRGDWEGGGLQCNECGEDGLVILDVSDEDSNDVGDWSVSQGDVEGTTQGASETTCFVVVSRDGTEGESTSGGDAPADESSSSSGDLRCCGGAQVD